MPAHERAGLAGHRLLDLGLAGRGLARLVAGSLSPLAIRTIGGILIAALAISATFRCFQTRADAIRVAKEYICYVDQVTTDSLGMTLGRANDGLGNAVASWRQALGPPGSPMTESGRTDLTNTLTNIAAAIPNLLSLAIVSHDGMRFGTFDALPGRIPPVMSGTTLQRYADGLSGRAPKDMWVDRSDSPSAITVTRRVGPAAGQPGGIAIALMRVNFVSDVEALTKLLPGTAIIITHADGTLVWSSQPGVSLRARAFQGLAAGASRDLTIGPDTGDPATLIVQHRMIDFPLVVTIIRPEALILAGWEKTSALIILVTGSFAILVGLMLWALLKQHHAVADLAATAESREQANQARIQTELLVQQAQRLEVVGRLTAGVAHDYNNLLMSVSGNLEFLERDPAVRSEHGPRLSMIRQAADRGASLTRQLLAASRKQILQPESIDLNALVRRTADLAREHGQDKAIVLELDLLAGLWPALVDPVQVENVVLNLTANARDALPEGGRLTVRTENNRVWWQDGEDDPATGDYAVLTVSDDGHGMAPEVLARACDPFFTTKEPGRGSGLGLSQVAGIVRQSGGAMKIESKVGQGTTVRLYLPRARDADVAEMQRPPFALREPRPPLESQSAKSQRIRVLVIDDDTAVLDIIVATLNAEGYEATAATSGREGLNHLHAGNDTDILLVDFAMPEMNGVEVAREVRRRWPGIPVTFMTGYADAGPLGGERFILQKPFRSRELLGMLRQALPSRTQAPVPQNVD